MRLSMSSRTHEQVALSQRHKSWWHALEPNLAAARHAVPGSAPDQATGRYAQAEEPWLPRICCHATLLLRQYTARERVRVHDMQVELSCLMSIDRKVV